MSFHSLRSQLLKECIYRLSVVSASPAYAVGEGQAVQLFAFPNRLFCRSETLAALFDDLPLLLRLTALLTPV